MVKCGKSWHTKNGGFMKQALQAILISPNLQVRLDIMLGRKRITIREGHRDYKVGPVIICCHIDPWIVLTKITDVRLTTLSEVTQEELEDDGYTDHRSMLEDLKKYYPEISPDSPVTVIVWGNLDPSSFYAERHHIEFYAKLCGLKM
jgi:hypothetical protein